mgnify:CR=1 FL=1
MIVCLVHLDDVLFGLWDVFELSVLGEDIQDFVNHVGQYALVVIGKSSAVDLFVIHKGRLVQRPNSKGFINVKAYEENANKLNGFIIEIGKAALTPERRDGKWLLQEYGL